MQDYISRQPIMNGKAEVCAYRLALGRSLKHCAGEDYGDEEAADQGRGSVFTHICTSLADRKTAFIDYFEALTHCEFGETTDGTGGGAVIVVGEGDPVGQEISARLKALGYRLARVSGTLTEDTWEGIAPDVIIVDFSAVTLAKQAALLRKYRNRAALLAENINTWGDFSIARDMGYDLFQGFFFLRPTGSPGRREIRSLDVCLTAILQELEKPEPRFKYVSDMIEHDLGLSYKLLRLVNSAYMAPKYKIRSIAQALAYLGTRELHQWIAMLMFNSIRSEENSELVSMSLIRGKMTALIASELQLAQQGSEPFFTGLFSLIDVILNLEMSAALSGLPLSDDVITALTSGGNTLSDLLKFVAGYEQADWQSIEGKYPLNRIPPQRMVSIYLEALRWSKLLDYPAHPHG